MGPMARDFSAAFGLGEDDQRIPNIDSDGVFVGAIHPLYNLNQEKYRRSLIYTSGSTIGKRSERQTLKLQTANWFWTEFDGAKTLP
jgi:hypothetical protein